MSGGARHLARIHGTEEDRATCPFFFKVGACRHSERCQRSHDRPLFSVTVLLPHVWQNPAAPGQPRKSPEEEENDFRDTFVDLFEGFAAFGEVEDMVIADNVSDHLVGNVFVKFVDEADAQKCLEGMKGRFYAGRPINPEYSPVTDFREARCRQFDTNNCARGLTCNFMHTHLLKNHPEFLKDLIKNQEHYGERSSSLPPPQPEPATARSSSRHSDGGGRGGRGRSRDRRRRGRSRSRDRRRR